MKSKPTRTGDKEHGAEVICLHEDDYNHQGDPDFFPIKLAYNGIHHYLPIVQRSVLYLPGSLQQCNVPHQKCQV